MGASLRQRGRSWLVTVSSNGQRSFVTVKSKSDAENLVREVRRLELAGVNVAENIAKARVKQPAQDFPKLKAAIVSYIESQQRSGAIRESTATNYTYRCRKWLFPALGSTPVNAVTREQLGAVITTMREQGKSATTIAHVCNPVRGYYAHLVETKVLAVNPAVDLRHFKGKARRKAQASDYFSREEVATLVSTAKEHYPRWAPFIMTGLLAGLRWGESGGLFKSDLDLKAGKLMVRRTLVHGTLNNPPKDRDHRAVVLTPQLVKALKAHVEAMTLEAQHEQWDAEQRELVFPTEGGRPVSYSRFLSHVWQPLLAKAKLRYRKYHSTRHSYATLMLESGADPRFVQKQLGHASIAMTLDLYGSHLVSESREALAKLDGMLK